MALAQILPVLPRLYRIKSFQGYRHQAAAVTSLRVARGLIRHFVNATPVAMPDC